VFSVALVTESTYLHFPLCRCLTNIATGDHEETAEVLPAVPHMIDILMQNRDSIALQEQICWAIGNIAGDCDEFRFKLLGNGCLPAVLRFLENSVMQLVTPPSSSSASSSSSSSPSRTQEAAAVAVAGGSSSSGGGGGDEGALVAAAQTGAWTLSNLARGSVPGSVFVESGRYTRTSYADLKCVDLLWWLLD
jgi:hypothetical protein